MNFNASVVHTTVIGLVYSDSAFYGEILGVPMAALVASSSRPPQEHKIVGSNTRLRLSS
jgi:hypothetical protein